MPKRIYSQCPKCGGFGTAGGGLCKRCQTLEEINEPDVKKEICTQCGKEAFKYFERSPYHSWYCEFHYNRKLEEFVEPTEVPIRRDSFKPSFGDNLQTKDSIVANTEFSINKDKFGLERDSF